MSTDIRPELSSRNPYYISKHRYYELKHYCLQYPEWQKCISTIDGYARSSEFPQPGCEGTRSDVTASRATLRAAYSNKVDLIERTAKEADPFLAYYILKAVTEGGTYEVLNARFHIPCCRDIFYDRYRRFFWLLDKYRN